MMSKCWKFQMNSSSSTMPIIGRRCGSVTVVNRRTGPAPSISAASCSSPGTVWRAARSMTMIQGKLAQVLATTSATMAQAGDESHGYGESMTCRPSRIALATP